MRYGGNRHYSPENRVIKFIEFLLNRYQEYGIKDFDDGLKPLIELSSLGNVKEIADDFGWGRCNR